MTDAAPSGERSNCWVELRHLGMFGLVEALVFIGILTVGLVYAWQRGALDWT